MRLQVFGFASSRAHVRRDNVEHGPNDGHRCEPKKSIATIATMDWPPKSAVAYPGNDMTLPG
jgi:hypothetical protein